MKGNFFWRWIARIEALLLAGLFFVLPIAFSHLPYLLGLPWSFETLGNYEGLKKAIFFGFSALLYIGTSFSRKVRISRLDGIFLGLLSIASVVQWIQDRSLSGVLFGVEPLYFGSLFPLALWMFFAVLRTMPALAIERAKKWLLLSLFFVTGYCIAQLTGFDPIANYAATFSLDRAFSTLGNPNMLAGYALLLLPFIVRERIAWAAILSVMALFDILASWSASLAAFAFLYVLWHFFKGAPANRYYYLLLLALAGLSLAEIIGFSGLLGSKLLSLETRGVLLLQAWSLFVHHPWAMLFGFPADTLMDLLDSERLAIVKLFIEDEVAIGNFHSLPVDIVTRFGIPAGAFVAYAISLFLRKNRSWITLESFVLFAVFSLLHMPEVTQFAILALGLADSWQKKTSR